jgi:hypothetical protein
LKHNAVTLAHHKTRLFQQDARLQGVLSTYTNRCSY